MRRFELVDLLRCRSFKKRSTEARENMEKTSGKPILGGEGFEGNFTVFLPIAMEVFIPRIESGLSLRRIETGRTALLRRGTIKHRMKSPARNSVKARLMACLLMGLSLTAFHPKIIT